MHSKFIAGTITYCCMSGTVLPMLKTGADGKNQSSAGNVRHSVANAEPKTATNVRLKTVLPMLKVARFSHSVANAEADSSVANVRHSIDQC